MSPARNGYVVQNSVGSEGALLFSCRGPLSIPKEEPAPSARTSHLIPGLGAERCQCSLGGAGFPGEGGERFARVASLGAHGSLSSSALSSLFSSLEAPTPSKMDIQGRLFEERARICMITMLPMSLCLGQEQIEALSAGAGRRWEPVN